MYPRPPSAILTRQAIGSKRTLNGRGEHLQSLTTSLVCFTPSDLTITHPTCPATLALDRVTKRIHIYDGTNWKPLVDTIVAQPEPAVQAVEIPREIVSREIIVPAVSGVAPSDMPQYTVFSDKDFTLFSNGMDESIVKFEIIPFNKTRTITVPRESALLPAIDNRDNTMLGSVVYASSEGLCKDNTLLGSDAGVCLSSGSYNTSVGSMSLSNCVTGSNNIAVGYKSMVDTASGTDNVAIGYKSLRKAQGECNLAIGSFAQALNVSGNGNVSIGQDSLYNLVSGNSNVAIGFEAGIDCNVGSDNVMVGSQTCFAPGTSGSIILGSGGKSTSSDQLVISGKMSGEVQLESGTGVIMFSGVTSSSRILVTCQNPIGTVGFLYISNRIPGTGFTISSSSSGDNSMVAWLSFEP
jgi:hypothetical protein